MIDEGLEDIGAAAETGVEAWYETGAASGVETASGAEETGLEAATFGFPDGESGAVAFAINVSFSCVPSNGTSSGPELFPVGREDEDMK